MNRDIELEQLIQQVMYKQLRFGTGLDFHSLRRGYPLVLAGISIPSSRGFHVRRSDGDPVSHSLIDAILAATGQGDIADWFNDQDGTVNARSIDYLGELREKVLAPQNITIINAQVIILAEKPKLKPYFHLMKSQIATRLGIDCERVAIQGKTYEGKGIIGRGKGIEVRSTISLLVPGA